MPCSSATKNGHNVFALLQIPYYAAKTSSEEDVKESLCCQRKVGRGTEKLERPDSCTQAAVSHKVPSLSQLLSAS